MPDSMIPDSLAMIVWCTVWIDGSIRTATFRRRGIPRRRTAAPLDLRTADDDPGRGQGRDLRPGEGRGARQSALIPVLRPCLQKVRVAVTFFSLR